MSANRIRRNIYWDDANGDDSNDGTSQALSVKTLERARALATDEGGGCYGIIIVSKPHKEHWRRQALDGGLLQCGNRDCAWCLNRLGLRKCKGCGKIVPSGRQRHMCDCEPPPPVQAQEVPQTVDRHRAMELFRKARDMIRKAQQLYPESKACFMYHVPNPDKVQEGHTKCFLHGFCRKSSIHIHDKDSNMVPRNTAHFRTVPQAVVEDYTSKKHAFNMAKKDLHASKNHAPSAEAQAAYEDALQEFVISHESHQYYTMLNCVTRFYLLFCNESELNRRANAASKLRNLCKHCHPPNAEGAPDVSMKHQLPPPQAHPAMQHPSLDPSLAGTPGIDFRTDHLRPELRNDLQHINLPHPIDSVDPGPQHPHHHHHPHHGHHPHQQHPAHAHAHHHHQLHPPPPHAIAPPPHSHSHVPPMSHAPQHPHMPPFSHAPQHPHMPQMQQPGMPLSQQPTLPHPVHPPPPPLPMSMVPPQSLPQHHHPHLGQPTHMHSPSVSHAPVPHMTMAHMQHHVPHQLPPHPHPTLPPATFASEEDMHMPPPSSDMKRSPSQAPVASKRHRP